MPTNNHQLSMHAARTALNNDPQTRAWAEEFLKERERAKFQQTSNAGATEEEFERHWRYVKPERMHEGAIEAVEAFQKQKA